MAPIVTAVAEPRPDGERIVKAIIELNGTVCDPGQITVKDRNITGCSQEGDVITLSLAEDDELAYVLPKPKRPDGPGPQGPGAGGPGGHGGPSMGGPGGHGGPRRPMPAKERKPIVVTVDIPGVGEITSEKSVETVIDDFVQGVYKNFTYNLFSPSVQDGVKYPLVVFIPDASANGPDPKITLSQGIGATVWAEEENQKKHPCYVLAINVPKEIHLTNDDFAVAPEFDQIKELIDKTIDENAVDESRIYMTGQSQGGMSTFKMNCLYPDFLAASLCVSNQWDPAEVGKLVGNKIFMALSSGGPKEYPGMSAIFEELTRNGAKTRRIDLDYKDGWDKINAQVNAQIGDANIIFAVFDKDTIWDDDPANHQNMEHHARGWAVAYQMEAARDWLFAQVKE